MTRLLFSISLMAATIISFAQVYIILKSPANFHKLAGDNYK